MSWIIDSVEKGVQKQKDLDIERKKRQQNERQAQIERSQKLIADAKMIADEFSTELQPFFNELQSGGMEVKVGENFAVGADFNMGEAEGDPLIYVYQSDDSGPYVEKFRRGISFSLENVHILGISITPVVSQGGLHKADIDIDIPSNPFFTDGMSATEHHSLQSSEYQRRKIHLPIASARDLNTYLDRIKDDVSTAITENAVEIRKRRDNRESQEKRKKPWWKKIRN